MPSPDAASFASPPLGAYEIVVGETVDFEHGPGWQLVTLRLGFRDLLQLGDLYAHPAWKPYASWPWFPRREEALEFGHEVAEWHRQRHLWYVPEL
jgi:hypothetical protein